MRAAEILTELHRRGVELRPRGDRIRFRPVTAVPPELLDQMRQHKSELLGMLADPRSLPLEARILAALPPGERLRSGVIAERVGVPLDHTSPARLLRLLPGRELFEALARLVDAGKVATDACGEFYLPTKRHNVDHMSPNPSRRG